MTTKKLYRASIKDTNEKDKEPRNVYIVSESMTKAATLLSEELSVDEELREIVQVSEEVYVG